MPNQPKTPARTFRLSDDTMHKLRESSTRFDSLTDAVRSAIDSMHAMNQLLDPSLVARAQAIREQMGKDECALHDLMYEGQLPEASRIMLNGGTRFAERLTAEAKEIEAAIRRDESRLERQRTLRDVISRLEGHAREDVNQAVIDSLKSLLE